MIEVYTQNVTVPAMTAIPFNNTTIQKGITAVKTGTATIQFNRIGVYVVSFDASASLADGATTSATSTSETDIVHMSFTTLVQVPQNNTCNCATSPTTIQITNIGVPALFAQADLVVTKLC